MTADRGIANGDRTTASDPLHRGLGVLSIVFMVVAAAAPMAVVVATTPIVVSVSESIAVPLFFLLAALILVLFTVGYVRMSRYVRNAGAFSSYVQAGLGRVQGVGAAILAIVSYSGLLLATSSYIGVSLASVVQRYTGADLPWWAFTFVVLIVVALLGYRDIELSSKVLGVLLILEVVAVVVLNVAVFTRGGADGVNADSLAPSAMLEGHAGLGLMFAFFAFFGFEATAVFRGEAKDPERTIPRATYTAVVFIGLFYALSGAAVIVGVGSENAIEAAQTDPENMVLGLATTFVGPVFFDIVQSLLVTSLFACILSFHNVVTRYAFTLGRRRILPARIGAVHSRHGAPSAASLAVSVASGLAMAVIVISRIDPVAESYTWLSGAATMGLVALMTLASVAVIVYFRTHDVERPVWQTLIAPTLAVLGLGTVLVLVAVNFTLLIPDPVAAGVVAGIVVAAYLGGLVVALIMRRSRPEAYAALSES